MIPVLSCSDQRLDAVAEMRLTLAPAVEEDRAVRMRPAGRCRAEDRSVEARSIDSPHSLADNREALWAFVDRRDVRRPSLASAAWTSAAWCRSFCGMGDTHTVTHSDTRQHAARFKQTTQTWLLVVDWRPSQMAIQYVGRDDYNTFSRTGSTVRSKL